MKKLRFMGEEVVGKNKEVAINENGFKLNSNKKTLKPSQVKLK